MNPLNELLAVPIPRINRSNLPANLWNAYDKLEKGLVRMDDCIRIADADECIDKYESLLITCVRLDHPAMFWIGQQYRHIVDEDGIYIEPRYTIPLSKAEELGETLMPEVARVDRATASTDHWPSIALSVHDHLCSHTSYSEEGKWCHTIVGSMLQHESVCDGISLAASIMLCRGGVPCGTVYGKLRSNDEWHAWNVLNLSDGSRLHMDVTNDIRGSFISHRHFLMSEAEAHKVLSWAGPVGPSPRFDYYHATGCRASTDDEMRMILKKMASTGTRCGELAVPENMGEERALDIYADTYLPLSNRGTACWFDSVANILSFSQNID